MGTKKPRDRRDRTERARQERRDRIQRENDRRRGVIEALARKRAAWEAKRMANQETNSALASSSKDTLIPTTPNSTTSRPPSNHAAIDDLEATGDAQPPPPGHAFKPTQAVQTQEQSRDKKMSEEHEYNEKKMG